MIRTFPSKKSGYTCVEFFNCTAEERYDMHTWVDENYTNDRKNGVAVLGDIVFENMGYFDARLKDDDMTMFLIKWA
jgi:hypothetical protein